VERARGRAMSELSRRGRLPAPSGGVTAFVDASLLSSGERLVGPGSARTDVIRRERILHRLLPAVANTAGVSVIGSGGSDGPDSSGGCDHG
jgi:hypothetical protein